MLVAAVVLPRVALPAAAAAGGLAVAVVAALTVPALSVSGVGSSLGSGTGTWVTLVAGVLTAACGLALLGASRRRTAAVATLVGGLLIATVQPSTPRAAAETGVETVLGVTDTGRLGGAAARLDVDSADLLDTDSRAPDVVSDGSRLWFVHESDYGEYVLVEVVDGHALPAAVLSADAVDLVAVRDDTAIVRAFLGTGDVIARVDLRHPDGYLESELGDHGGTITLVSSAGSGSRPSTGSFDGTLLTQGAADGSVVVYAAPRGSNSAQFRIAGDRLLGPARWPLTARTRIAGGDAAASAPLMIDRDFEPPALHAVADRGGARKVVLGGVTDTRCSPSRDPLSTSADQFALDPSGVAMDRAGRIWVAAYPSAHSAGSGVLVVDHGVLRHLDLGRVATVTALADGSMLVSDGRGRRHHAPRHRSGDRTRGRTAAADRAWLRQ